VFLLRKKYRKETSRESHAEIQETVKRIDHASLNIQSKPLESDKLQNILRTQKEQELKGYNNVDDKPLASTSFVEKNILDLIEEYYDRGRNDKKLEMSFRKRFLKDKTFEKIIYVLISLCGSLAFSLVTYIGLYRQGNNNSDADHLVVGLLGASFLISFVLLIICIGTFFLKWKKN
jgi:hypothetical protein